MVSSDCCSVSRAVSSSSVDFLADAFYTLEVGFFFLEVFFNFSSVARVGFFSGAVDFSGYYSISEVGSSSSRVFGNFFLVDRAVSSSSAVSLDIIFSTLEGFF